MWILAGAATVVLAAVIGMDFRIRKQPGRKTDERICQAILAVSLLLLVFSLIWKPATAVGLLLALAFANAFIVFQRARSLGEVARIKDAQGGEHPAEAPYEQFINTFFSYFDRGEADALEFEFRQWKMEIRFKKGEQVIPVAETPFHMLLQIKRLFDAATAKNPKTGVAKMRYVARGVFYEFLSEDSGGTLLRLRLINKRPASPDEVKNFDRTLAGVR